MTNQSSERESFWERKKNIIKEWRLIDDEQAASSVLQYGLEKQWSVYPANKNEIHWLFYEVVYLATGCSRNGPSGRFSGSVMVMLKEGASRETKQFINRPEHMELFKLEAMIEYIKRPCK